MRKNLILLIAFMISLNLCAQTVAPPVYADVNDDYKTYINNIFGALEANRKLASQNFNQQCENLRQLGHFGTLRLARGPLQETLREPKCFQF